jgi:hypothetical protein
LLFAFQLLTSSLQSFGDSLESFLLLLLFCCLVAYSTLLLSAFIRFHQSYPCHLLISYCTLQTIDDFHTLSVFDILLHSFFFDLLYISFDSVVNLPYVDSE